MKMIRTSAIGLLATFMASAALPAMAADASQAPVATNYVASDLPLDAQWDRGDRRDRGDRSSRRDRRDDRSDRRGDRGDDRSDRRRDRRDWGDDRRDRRADRRDDRRDQRRYGYRDQRTYTYRDQGRTRPAVRDQRRYRYGRGYSHPRRYNNSRRWEPRNYKGWSVNLNLGGYYPRSSIRWASSDYYFYNHPGRGYRAGGMSFHRYRSLTSCRWIQVDDYWNGDPARVELKECSNPYHGRWAVRGTARLLYYYYW